MAGSRICRFRCKQRRRGSQHGIHLRGEIYDFVRDLRITGFATIAGDRHSFWAGLAAKGLPPKPFEPVGIAFVTGSISAPGIIEAFEHVFPKDHPLRSLFVGQAPSDTTIQPLMNMLLRHGVTVMPGVRAERRYSESASAVKSRSFTTLIVCRYGWPWLRGGSSHQRSIRD